MKLEISGKTELALEAIRVLARHDEVVKGAELAGRLETTPHYIPQVLRPLIQRGWIESDRGPTGGYRLAADPADISLCDLIETVEGPLDESRCVLRGKPCPAVEKCALHFPWQRARAALIAELMTISLADIPMGEEAA